jgi:CRP-like cAMP-binding protein
MEQDLLTADVRHEMISRALKWRFQPGELLIVQGSQPNCLILVAEGDVQVEIRKKSSGVRVLARRSAGSIIGEMSLLIGIPRTAHARAITLVNAWMLPAGEYYDLTRRFPALETTLMHLAVNKLANSCKDRVAERRYADLFWTAALAAASSAQPNARALMFVQRTWKRNR